MSEIDELLDAAVASLGGTHRAGQQEMAQAVSSALSSGVHLLVQAGTGTGKSLAYLVPAVEYAVRTGDRVVVSTATLALQAQIIDRDLPKLVKALSPTVKTKPSAAVLKGRRNYLCKHKLDGGYPDDYGSMLFDLGADDAANRRGGNPSALEEEISRICSWERTTTSGDRDDLIPGVSDRAWSNVSVNSFDCLGTRCPVYDECFAELARTKAAAADIVVTNHALLAIDAFGDSTVLPEHAAVIIDEAHELRDRVTNALTGTLNSKVIGAAVSSARRHGSVQEGELLLVETAALALEKALGESLDGLIRVWPEALSAALVSLRDAARQVVSGMNPERGQAPDAGAQMARARMQEIFDLAERLADPGAGDVAWVSRSTFREVETTSLVVAPLSVAGTLRNGIFAESTVIATSATLALGGKFEPVAASLGLAGPEAPRYDAIDVGSPFDYEKQGILYVASDLPKPGRGGLSAQAVEELIELVTASGGGALGLFSSKAAAVQAAEALREATDLTVLLQGEDGLSVLVRQFAAEPDACLMGTMSLWQGVDVPGQTCRLVIIDRIPFPRPDDPLAQARTQAAASRGANGFMAVSATHAALRLAQGVGRLIRTSSDRGVVAILDSRLRSAGYGGFLAASLPPLWRTESAATVREALKRLSS